MDIQTFRQDFPEFASVTDYPDALIKFWSDLTELSVSKDACGAQYVPLVELGTAHYITIAKNNALSAAAGASPGSGGGGVVASKTVGDISVNYDTAIAANANAGDWNRTTYGEQYHRMIRLLGAGGLQVC